MWKCYNSCTLRTHEHTRDWIYHVLCFRNVNAVLPHRHECCHRNSHRVSGSLLLPWECIKLIFLPSVPIYEIWLQATRSGAAATTFITLLALIAFFSLNGCQQTSSRLTWAFARDDALILSKFIGRIHPVLQVPVNALLANSLVVFIIGCIYLASSTAFNALIGTGLVLQQVSFCFPAALLIFRKRSSTYLPSHRFFNMGRFGWASNIVTLLFGILTLIFYNFPAEMPVTGGNMSMD